jgi:hypothetical protein
VSPRRVLRFAVALVIAVSVQAVYAAPVRSMKEWRSAHCCRTRCGVRTAPCAMGCCQVRSSAPDTATAAHASEAPAPVIATAALPEPPPWIGVGIEKLPAATGRAGPLFLLTRTLRL